MIVAIDGPAGAGKSTVAKRLAHALGIDYLDTGAMYRAVTFGVMQRDIDVADETAVVSALSTMSIDVSDTVMVDGVDATLAIRGPEVTAAVSAVAANPRVRESLVALQRAWVVKHGGGVVEGRDISTVVFPDADVKLFITASPRVRAERRVAESGGDVDEVARLIEERDRRDSTRAASPLSVASDATVVDTSGLSLDEVLAEVLELVDGVSS